MKSLLLCALAGSLSLGAQLFAQTTTSTGTITTGIVGLSVNQNARLNILNVNPNTATPVVCSADVQFAGAGGATLKQRAIPNIDPGKAASFQLDRSEIADQATPAIYIRGVVATPSAAATPAPAPCNLVVTLEIVDDATARTNVVIGGRAVPSK